MNKRTRALREELSSRPVARVDAQASNRFMRLSTRLVCEVLEFVDKRYVSRMAQTCSSMRAMCSLSLCGPLSPLLQMRTHLHLHATREAMQTAIVQRFRQLRYAYLWHIYKRPLSQLVRHNGATLTRLELSFYRAPGTICSVLLPALQHCPNLHTLDVRWDERPNSEDGPSVSPEHKLSNLHTLTLRNHTRFQMKRLREFVAVAPHVTHLSLTWPGIPHAYLHDLGDLCPKLETLQLCCRYHELDMKLDGSKLKHLRRLDVDHERICWTHDPDIRYVSVASAIPPALTDLHMNLLDFALPMHVVQSPLLPHLTDLAIDHTYLPERFLYHMPALRMLTLPCISIHQQTLWNNLSPYLPEFSDDKKLKTEMEQRPRELWAPQLALVEAVRHETVVTASDQILWEQTRHVMRVRAATKFKFYISKPCSSLLCPICHP